MMMMMVVLVMMMMVMVVACDDEGHKLTIIQDYGQAIHISDTYLIFVIWMSLFTDNEMEV